MSHNRDLSAAAAQIGFHSSNIGIGTDAPSETITLNHANGASIGLEYGGSEHGSLNVNSAAMYARAGSGKHLILGGNATESLRLKSDGKAYFTGNLGLGGQTSPSGTIHINDLSANGYELKVTGNALQFNRSSNSYIDQLHDTGSILFRMTSSNTEAMRITSAGNLGIGAATGSQVTKELTIRPGNDGGIRFVRPGATSGSPNSHLDLTTTTSGSVYLSGGEAYTVKYNTYNNDQIFETYEGGGTGGYVVFKTAPQGGTPSDRIVIDMDGTLLVNSTIDNTSHHGRIVAHAPTSGTTIYKAIEIGNTSGSGTARGAAICGQPKSNSHLPYTLIGSWDHGDNTDIYYGGGWGGAMRPATRHRFYTNSSYPTSSGSGTQNMTLDGNGHLTLPNQPVFQATGQPSHRYMNSWHSVDLPNWNYVTQNGSHFNNSTGRFTAPVAGKYYFIFTAMFTNPSTNDVATYIIKNGTTEVLSNNHSGGGSSNGHQWNDITVHAIVNMAANDWVSSRMVGNSSSTCYFYGSSGSKYGSFCGFLIG